MVCKACCSRSLTQGSLNMAAGGCSAKKQLSFGPQLHSGQLGADFFSHFDSQRITAKQRLRLSWDTQTITSLRAISRRNDAYYHENHRNLISQLLDVSWWEVYCMNRSTKKRGQNSKIHASWCILFHRFLLMFMLFVVYPLSTLFLHVDSARQSGFILAPEHKLNSWACNEAFHRRESLGVRKKNWVEQCGTGWFTKLLRENNRKK